MKTNQFTKSAWCQCRGTWINPDREECFNPKSGPGLCFISCQTQCQKPELLRARHELQPVSCEVRQA